MRSRGFLVIFLISVFLFSSGTYVFAGNVSPAKRGLEGQLTQARKDFTLKRDKLHDQIRVMRIAWHNERAALYAQAKQSPKDKTIKAALNEGAKKYFADRKDVYNQLVELRKNWLNARKDLGRKIKQAK
ncbi:MAG: hypothetical protein M0R48_09115 [Candidatus Omnitrophica bacterium]|jgi:hypothetical protein|nr:hypothetical protein [Candidatus Omnitrophota bacterium]